MFLHTLWYLKVYSTVFSYNTVHSTWVHKAAVIDEMIHLDFLFFEAGKMRCFVK